MASGMLLGLNFALMPMTGFGNALRINMIGDFMVTLSWVWFGLMLLSPVLTLILWEKCDAKTRMFGLLYPGFFILTGLLLWRILNLFFEFGEYGGPGTESPHLKIIPLILFIVTVSGIIVLKVIRSNKEPCVDFRMSKKAICCSVVAAVLVGIFAVWKVANSYADVGPEKTSFLRNRTFVVSDDGDVAFKSSTNHVIEHLYGGRDRRHVGDRILIEFQDPKDTESRSCKVVQATRTGPRYYGYLWNRIPRARMGQNSRVRRTLPC